MDASNSAMIQKLMARKKSYERMMNIEETIGNHRSPIAYMADLTNKKNQDILMSAQRPLPLSRLAKIENGTTVKKQLQQYYAHAAEDQGLRIAPKLKQQRMIGQQQLANVQTLDVTGQKVLQTNKVLNTYKSNSNIMNENA